MKRWGQLFALTLLCSALTACISSLWTGASFINDRHHWYKKLDDLQLLTQVKQALYRDGRLKGHGCAIEMTVFRKDILVTGYVATQSLRSLVDQRMQAVSGKRHYYNELSLEHESKSSDFVLDSWITAKIRAEILADSSIDPGQFKVVTSNRVVYLMGDVIPEQAEKVVMFAREWSEVKRVVKLFQYYQLHSPAALTNSPNLGRSSSIEDIPPPANLDQTPG